MKKFFISAIVLCASLMSSAQLVNVESISKVNLPQGMAIERLTISPDGSFAVISGSQYSGLQKIDLATGEISNLVAGVSLYNAKISADGSQVVYYEPSFKDRLRYVSLKSVDVNTGKVTEIVKPSRHLNSGVSLNGNTVNAVENGNLKAKALAGGKTEKAAVVSINYGHLDVTVNGKTTSIDPQGRGSYLWPSISPDGKKIVYWCVGHGCFVCDLDGSNAQSLGTLRAAVWAGNDMVVGMRDIEGYNQEITESSIIASDLKGNKQTLTDSNVKAISPSATADGSKIAFTTTEGELYIINLK